MWVHAKPTPLSLLGHTCWQVLKQELQQVALAPKVAAVPAAEEGLTLTDYAMLTSLTNSACPEPRTPADVESDAGQDTSNPHAHAHTHTSPARRAFLHLRPLSQDTHTCIHRAHHLRIMDRLSSERSGITSTSPATAGAAKREQDSARPAEASRASSSHQKEQEALPLLGRSC